MLDISKEQKALEERLSQENFGIVVSQALRFPTNAVCDLEDYIQVGAQAFILATRHWQPNKGTKWSTYVTTCVHRAISKEAFKFKHTLSASHHANKLASRVSYMLQKGLAPQTIAEELDINVKSVEHLKSLFKTVTHHTHELLTNNYDNRDIAVFLLEVVEGLLTDTEYQSLELRLRGYTFKQIGNIIGMSKESARRIINVSILKLRNHYEEENSTV